MPYFFNECRLFSNFSCLLWRKFKIKFLIGSIKTHTTVLLKFLLNRSFQKAAHDSKKFTKNRLIRKVPPRAGLRHVHCTKVADIFSFQWGRQEKSWPMTDKESRNRKNILKRLLSLDIVNVYREASKLHFFSLQKAADKLKTIVACTENTDLFYGPQKESSSRDPFPFEILPVFATYQPVPAYNTCSDRTI